MVSLPGLAESLRSVDFLCLDGVDERTSEGIRIASGDELLRAEWDRLQLNERLLGAAQNFSTIRRLAGESRPAPLFNARLP